MIKLKMMNASCKGILAASILALTPMLYGQTETSVEIQDARSALEEWVETKRVISKEKRDLQLAKEMLSERIRLVEREIESLQAKMKEAEGSIQEADKKKAELEEERDQLKNASSSLEDVLGAYESQLKALLKRLPDPIRDRVKPLTQRLPKDGEEIKLSLSERFQNVVGILNEIEKFNRDITVTSELRNFDDGTSAEVTTLYIGLGQAFYTGSNGKLAGRGRATNEGWVWESIDDPEAGKEIANAIAILNNEQVASFVQLPAKLD